MMLRSLQSDAARIGFESESVGGAEPGKDTAECVLHGQVWLMEALQARLERDLVRHGLGRLFLTGGDASLFAFSGVRVERSPSLVLDGLEAIVQEDAAR
jgi:type III pantothenate kinase